MQTTAARHPHVTVTKASAGATAIFASEADPARSAPGSPRFAGGCQENAAVCVRGPLGPSAKPNSIRLITSTAKLAVMTIGSIAADQSKANTASAHLSVVIRAIAPEKKPPIVKVRKNKLPTRPIWDAVNPNSLDNGWAMMPKTALSPQLMTVRKTSSEVKPQARRRDSGGAGTAVPEDTCWCVAT